MFGSAAKASSNVSTASWRSLSTAFERGVMRLRSPPVVSSFVARRVQVLLVQPTPSVYRGNQNAIPMKPCAVFLIVLVMLPFTAPFRTCDGADLTTSRTDGPVPVAAAISSPTTNTDDDGSLVASIATDTGRVRRTPLIGAVAATFDVTVAAEAHALDGVSVDRPPQPLLITVLRV